MKINDLTIEQVKAMSQEEIFYWGEQFARREKEEALRKLMIDRLEIIEAEGIIQ